MGTFTREAVEQLSAQQGEPAWMREKRLRAFEVYQSLPMPTLKDEAWRRTDIRGLELEAIGPSLNGHGGTAKATDRPEEEQGVSGMVTLVDGETAYRHLAETAATAGVIFCDMQTAVREHGDLVQRYFMSRLVRPEDGKFAALHGAFWRSGVFLYVPAGVAIDQPLHSITRNAAGRTFGHTLVVLEAGAQATLVSEYVSEGGEKQALHNGAVELLVGDGARLRYLSLQEWGRNLWQFTNERASVGRNAELDWVVGVLGSRLTKSFQTVDLDGPGATARISGLYFAEGLQHLDLDTEQNHNQPDTTSDLLYKGALKERGRSVWQGMIRVQPGAQRTNGYQANRNLVLAKSARADSIPGLEIQADDVRCTHGSTVGQVDEDEVFYLMTRGLPRPEATRLIVGGFFAPLLERIPLDSVRERLQATIEARV